MEEERVQTTGTGSLCHHWWILFFALFDYHGIVQCSTSMTHYNYRTVRSHGTVPYRYRSGTGVCTVQYGTVRPQSLYYLRKFFCVLKKNKSSNSMQRGTVSTASRMQYLVFLFPKKSRKILIVPVQQLYGTVKVMGTEICTVPYIAPRKLKNKIILRVAGK